MGRGQRRHGAALGWSELAAGFAGALPTQNLLTVWGTATDLFVAGSNGTLLRRDKDQWQPVASGLPMGVNINGMWGARAPTFGCRAATDDCIALTARW